MLAQVSSAAFALRTCAVVSPSPKLCVPLKRCGIQETLVQTKQLNL